MGEKKKKKKVINIMIDFVKSINLVGVLYMYIC